MLKPWQSLAVFLLSCWGFRETFILRNILVMFPLDYRKNMYVSVKTATGDSPIQ